MSCKVISASRRVEMVGFHTDRLIGLLKRRCPPERTHTIVLWSKSPCNIVTHEELRRTLKLYTCFLHLTVTGMGSSCLEPGIPHAKYVIALLPEIIVLLGNPERIALRFDPVVHLRLPGGRTYSNLAHFQEIVRAAAGSGIRHMIVSQMQAYPKVKRRLAHYGIEAIDLTAEQSEEEKDWMKKEAANKGIELLGCCTKGLTHVGCIDGTRLSRLHPGSVAASCRKAEGQREECTCTESWDIGWYYPCPGGCVYCYANPVIFSERKGNDPSMDLLD